MKSRSHLLSLSFPFPPDRAGSRPAGSDLSAQSEAEARGVVQGRVVVGQPTALPVRESGQFVKSPSVFVKRIAFVREYRIEDGAAIPGPHRGHRGHPSGGPGRAEHRIRSRHAVNGSGVPMTRSRVVPVVLTALFLSGCSIKRIAVNKLGNAWPAAVQPSLRTKIRNWWGKRCLLASN